MDGQLFSESIYKDVSRQHKSMSILEWTNLKQFVATESCSVGVEVFLTALPLFKYLNI